jgi:glycosyltransferase involved in cell wall biosynthesis
VPAVNTKLLILTEIIAPYRIPVFNSLAQQEHIDLLVVFLAETDPANRQWHIYKDEIQFPCQVLPSWRTKLGRHTVLLNHSVSRALSRMMPDVVLCGGYNYLASWQAQRWAKRRQVPFLLWSESTAQDQRSGARLTASIKRNFFKKCDGFVVPGTSAKRYAGQMGASEKKIFIAPNAIDNDLFSSLASAARKNLNLRKQLGLPPRYFLCVARLIESKGIFDLLRAYSRLGQQVRSEVGLVIVGHGPLRNELERLAHTISPGMVHVPGFVHREELAGYYALAECLVFPTHSDTWGLVVNEAMACGLPVICSAVAGCAADLMKNNGRVVAPHDISELSRTMEELASDSPAREGMSRQSRAIIRHYSPEQCARSIAEAAIAACNGLRAEDKPYRTAFSGAPLQDADCE